MHDNNDIRRYVPRLHLLADEDQESPTETLEQKMEKVRNLPEEERRKVSEFIDQFTGDAK